MNQKSSFKMAEAPQPKNENFDTLETNYQEEAIEKDFNPDLERVHIFQVKISLKFFDNSEKKIRTQQELFLIAS